MEELLKQCNLKMHHIGCITADIEESKKNYTDVLGFRNVSKTFLITDQKVRVCFIETAPGCYIELVEATEENKFFSKLLKSKAPFYHIGYLTEDFDATISCLGNNRFHLINCFNSEAFEGKRCSFLYTPEMHLIEIIENIPGGYAL